MKIVVCVKQVPGTSDAKIDPDTKRIIREGIKSIMNPFDLYAVEEAVLLRERFGGEVIAVSMGPERASAVIREALSIGADRGALLSDRAFGGSDTWATSYALARAVDTIGGVDLVICGKQAVDGDTAQVGPGIAAHLGFSQAAYAARVVDVSKNSITVQRMNEDGYDVCELSLPAVVTVVKGINQPRVPSLRGVIAARAADVPVWKPADINADVSRIGLDASPTRVVRTAPPEPRAGRTERVEGSPGECAARLIELLNARELIQGVHSSCG
ncbi:MAG: electron transfer flavoprotein subunit beta/FixA family protein [Oscillospiraceae bacterium]|jgi:electron transfer flavoprotein beta subunit|nr:electron transfer flavoprotein subunit beta/FixA family protein [Oscillospiraceae bacterium]